jgi:hypothetical protein
LHSLYRWQQEETMKMSREEEKQLLSVARKLKSEKSREYLISTALAMVQAQDEFKEDSGLVGPDAPIFSDAGVTSA